MQTAKSSTTNKNEKISFPLPPSLNIIIYYCIIVQSLRLKKCSMPLVTRRFGTISPKPKEKTSINGKNQPRYVQIKELITTSSADDVNCIKHTYLYYSIVVPMHVPCLSSHCLCKPVNICDPWVSVCMLTLIYFYPPINVIRNLHFFIVNMTSLLLIHFFLF